MQKDSAADIELNLKKKARRRLVGAIALVILMIVLLPILLEDRSSTVSHEDVKITIHNENAAVTEVTTTPPSLGEFDSSVVSADQASSSVKLPLPTPEPKETTNTDSPAIVDEDPEAAPAAVPTKPKVSAPIETPKTTNANEQYFVQVGVFSDANNVKQLQTRLKSLGYASRTEKITTPKGVKIRLRSQVFSSRNEAAIALQNIKASGLTGMVVSQ
jgi:DedD protein